MKTMNSMTNTLSRQKKEDGVVISYVSYIPIQSSTPPLSTPPYTHHTTDSIDSSSSSSSSFPFTKRSKQKTSSQSLSYILQTFLYGDLTSSLSDLGKWNRWSRDRGYTGSRVILSDNRLLLLASSKEGNLDIFELPHSRGGVRDPVLRHKFTSVHIGILTEMLACKNVSGGYRHCGYCPSCLSFQTDRKVFVNKRSEIKRLESEIVELRELLEKGPKVISHLRSQVRMFEKCGYEGAARIFGKRLKRVEAWVDDPVKHLRCRELEVERLKRKERMLKGSSKLIQEPHWFISISCPSPLHVVFAAQDAWLARRVQGQGRRVPEGVQRILGQLGAKDAGFKELMRSVFRESVAEAIQAQRPGVELTMEHQMHPFNKYDDAPDVHFLVCKKTLGKEGQAVDVAFDTDSLMREVEARMRVFADFVEWAVRRWNGGCRATEFKRWRRDMIAGIREIRACGIPKGSVDVRLVPVPELLGAHCYIRRQPMENVRSLFVEYKTGRVTVRYYRGGTVDCGVVDLLWRLVGFDGRSLGVRYGGAYRSTRGLKRDRKVDALYEALRESGPNVAY